MIFTGETIIGFYSSEQFTLNGHVVPCAIGRSSMIAAADEREGQEGWPDWPLAHSPICLSGRPHVSATDPSADRRYRAQKRLVRRSERPALQPARHPALPGQYRADVARGPCL